MTLIPGSGAGADQLTQFIERIERLEEEKRALMADIRDVYSEAKGTGFEPKIMRQLVKMRAMDRELLQEQDELLETYRAAVGLVCAGDPQGRRIFRNPPSRRHPQQRHAALHGHRSASGHGAAIVWQQHGAGPSRHDPRNFGFYYGLPCGCEGTGRRDQAAGRFL